MFNNPANRCIMKGYLVTDIQPYQDTDYAITFDIKVERPHQAGKPNYTDTFTVYVADKQNVNNCKAYLTKGMSVSVKGEMRVWNDGAMKLCANTVTHIW
ncbi:MAG: single-stranded DNA-binding protein [Oscillospiraceae bacterium]